MTHGAQPPGHPLAEAQRPPPTPTPPDRASWFAFVLTLPWEWKFGSGRIDCWPLRECWCFFTVLRTHPHPSHLHSANGQEGTAPGARK